MSKWEDLSMHERHAFIKTAVKNGIRDIGSIREKYNEYADGGKKRGYKSANSWSTANVLNSLRQNLADNIDPTMDYKYSIPAVGLASIGIDTHGMFTDDTDMSNITGNPAINQEIWERYLQREKPYKYTSEADYRPIGDTEDYYKVNIGNKGKSALVRETSKLPEFGKYYSSNVLGGYGMNNHSIAKAIDPQRGEYVAYKDTYDLNPFHGSRSIADLPLVSDMDDISAGVGKPVNLYDRVYLDDYYGISSAPEEGTYYGGYIPEVTVKGKKRKKANGGGLDFLDKPFSYKPVPSVRYAYGGPKGNVYEGEGEEPDLLDKAINTVKGLFTSNKSTAKPTTKHNTVYKDLNGHVWQTLEEAKNSNRLIREGNARYKQTGYLTSRQSYFDIDKEFTDSVKSISRRYGINPNLLASRIAKEGPIDEALRAYNGTDKQGIPIQGRNRGMLISKDPSSETIGPIWGLDDLGTHIDNGSISLTTTAPYDLYTDVEMENERGRTTYSVYSPQWWMGIEGTAAELANRRSILKKRYPNMSEQQLDAAAAASFNHGLSGVDKAIKSRYYKNYKPFIKLK